MPTYSLDDKDFAIFCNWYETESTFAMTKVEFPVGDSGGAYILNYPRKRYGCWARTTFAPVRPVEAQTKESFSVLDLEVEGQALVCKVNLGS